MEEILSKIRSNKTRFLFELYCTGSINNSDLELCGNIAHHDVVAQFADISERTIAPLLDNIANVFWLPIGSITTTGPATYLL